MIPLGLILAALPDLMNGRENVWVDTEFLLTLAAAVLCLGLIRLSKTRYYRFTSVLTILVAYVTIVLAAVPSDGLDDLFILYFLVIPIAFSVFFLPKWGTWVTGGVVILTVFLFPLFESAVPYPKIIYGPLSFFLIIVPLVGYVNHHRMKFEAFQRDVMARYLEQMRTVYHLGHAVGRVGSLSEIYDLAMSGLLHTLPVDRTAVLLFDEHGKMQFQAWRGLSDAYREQLDGHSPWEANTKNPAPVFVSSLEDPSVADFREALEKEGIQSLAFIPLVQNGRLLGKFMLYCNQPHIFTEIEAQVAQTIASHVSLAIVRLQDMQALRESEERYRHIIGHASDLIVQVDRQGTYQFVSPSYCQLFGKSIDEVLGTHIRDYIHPDDLPKVRGMLAALIKPPHNGYLEQRSLTVKGWRWLAWHDQAILDDEGRVVAVIGVGRDITEKKEDEEQLRLYARRLEILHEVERAVVTAVSQHEIMQTAVDAICDLLNCPIGAVVTIDEQKQEAALLVVNRHRTPHFPVGSTFPLYQTPLLQTFRQGEIVIQKGYEEIIKETGRVLSEKIQAAIYVPLIAHNTLMGILFLAAYEETTFTETWVDVASELGGTLALALHQSGLYAKVEAYAQELEARVEARTAELMEANARLSQLDQLKTKFIADVSHELRTPITNLSLYTDLLQVGGSGDKQHRYIEVLKEQTARLRRLVEGIFYMSRLDSLRLEELTCETVNLQTLVKQAVVG
ncbi:MAG: PAS domain S-box protein, partial [Bacteroidetes bacterium]